MLSRIASLWKRAGPMIKVGGNWIGVTEGLIKVNGVWKRMYPLANHYSAVVRFAGPFSNVYWDRYYSFGRNLETGGVDVGSVSTQVTVDGLQVAGLAITVNAAGGGPDDWRRFELSLFGDTRSVDIPEVWINGVRGALKQPPVLSGPVTIYFYDMSADIVLPSSINMVEF